MCDSSDDNRSYAVKFSAGTAVGLERYLRCSCAEE